MLHLYHVKVCYIKILNLTTIYVSRGQTNITRQVGHIDWILSKYIYVIKLV